MTKKSKLTHLLHVQENLVSAAPNVILNLLQIQLCKILYCLRSLNDAKPASQARQGSMLLLLHKSSSFQQKTTPECYCYMYKTTTYSSRVQGQHFIS